MIRWITVLTLTLGSLVVLSPGANAASFYTYFDAYSNIGIRNSSGVATISGGAIRAYAAYITPLNQIIETHYKADSRTIYGRSTGTVGAGTTYLYHSPKANAVSRCYYYDPNYSTTNWQARKVCSVYQ